MHVILKFSAGFAFTSVLQYWNCFFSHHKMMGILHLPLNMKGNLMLGEPYYGQYQSPQDAIS